MNFKSTIVIYFLHFAVTYITVSGLLIDKDGGYKDVLIAVSPNLKEHENVTLLTQNVYESLNFVSKALFKATNRTLFIKHVNFIVPSSFFSKMSRDLKNKFPLPANKITENFDKADVRIDIPHPFYGNNPYTLQSSGCGYLGHYIHLTPEYLTNSQIPLENRVKDLVHQWAKYRFGVFDERGYIGDKLYPSFYTDNSIDPKPTGCSNTPIIGDTINNFENTSCKGMNLTEMLHSHCKFIPFDNMTNADVVSSLMYLYDLHNVTSFCDSKYNRHNIVAPSKHNFLCKMKNIWDIVTSSNDYNSVSEPVENVPNLQMTLSKIESKTKFIMAVDVSTRRNINYRSYITRYAIDIAFETFNFKFTDGQTIALKYAKDAQSVKQGTVEFSKLENAKVSCIKCAVAKAISMAKNQDIYNFILITDGFIKDSDMNNTKDALKAHPINMFVILYPVNTNVQKWMSVARKVYVVEEKTYIETLNQLNSVIASIFNFISNEETSYYFSTLNRDKIIIGKNKILKGHFQLPSFTKKVLFILISEKNLQELSVTIGKDTLPGNLNGNVFYTSKWNYDNQTWSFTAVADEISILICYQTKDLKISGWTNSDDIALRDPRQPMAIYFQMLTKYNPVAGIDVIAILKEIDSDDNSPSVTIQLSDNGNSQPDITGNDGIYSGFYLDNVKADTPYSIQFKVRSSNLIETFIVTNRSWVDDNCCGSYVPIKDEKRIYFYGFETHFTLSSVTVKFDINKNKFPPLRITNLEITEVGQSTVDLKWSAPRRKYHLSSTYEVGMSFIRSELLTNDSIWKATGLAPSVNRSVETCTLQIPITDIYKILYITFRTKNSHGIFSDHSNIIEAFVRNAQTVVTSQTTDGCLFPDSSTVPTTTITTTTTIAPQPPKYKSSDPDDSPILTDFQKTLIIIFSFVIVLFIITLIVIIVYCKIKKDKLHADEKPSFTDWEKQNASKIGEEGAENNGFIESGYDYLKAFSLRSRPSATRDVATQTRFQIVSGTNYPPEDLSNLYAKVIKNNRQPQVIQKNVGEIHQPSLKRRNNVDDDNYMSSEF